MVTSQSTVSISVTLLLFFITITNSTIINNPLLNTPNNLHHQPTTANSNHTSISYTSNHVYIVPNRTTLNASSQSTYDNDTAFGTVVNASFTSHINSTAADDVSDTTRLGGTNYNGNVGVAVNVSSVLDCGNKTDFKTTQSRGNVSSSSIDIGGSDLVNDEDVFNCRIYVTANANETDASNNDTIIHPLQTGTSSSSSSASASASLQKWWFQKSKVKDATADVAIDPSLSQSTNLIPISTANAVNATTSVVTPTSKFILSSTDNDNDNYDDNVNLPNLFDDVHTSNPSPPSITTSISSKKRPLSSTSTTSLKPSPPPLPFPLSPNHKPSLPLFPPSLPPSLPTKSSNTHDNKPQVLTRHHLHPPTVTATATTTANTKANTKVIQQQQQMQTISRHELLGDANSNSVNGRKGYDDSPSSSSSSSSTTSSSSYSSPYSLNPPPFPPTATSSSSSSSISSSVPSIMNKKQQYPQLPPASPLRPPIPLRRQLESQKQSQSQSNNRPITNTPSRSRSRSNLKTDMQNRLQNQFKPPQTISEIRLYHINELNNSRLRYINNLRRKLSVYRGSRSISRFRNRGRGGRLGSVNFESCYGYGDYSDDEGHADDGDDDDNCTTSPIQFNVNNKQSGSHKKHILTSNRNQNQKITLTLKSIHQITFMLTITTLLSYISVSPHTLGRADYLEVFKGNLKLCLIVAAPSFVLVWFILNDLDHDRDSSNSSSNSISSSIRNFGLNQIINTIHTSYTYAYPTIYTLEILLATLSKLLVYTHFEPSMFKASAFNGTPYFILPWILNDGIFGGEGGYRVKRITTFVCDVVVACFVCTVFEEGFKVWFVGHLLDTNTENIASTSADAGAGASNNANGRRDKIINQKPQSKPNPPSLKAYTKTYLLYTVGLKLIDQTRRVLLYTKPYNNYKEFYALSRGLYPINELASCLTALGVFRRDFDNYISNSNFDDIEGNDRHRHKHKHKNKHRSVLEIARIIAPAVLLKAMANFKGMKPIYKWDSGAPWCELQFGSLLSSPSTPSHNSNSDSNSNGNNLEYNDDNRKNGVIKYLMKFVNVTLTLSDVTKTISRVLWGVFVCRVGIYVFRSYYELEELEGRRDRDRDRDRYNYGHGGRRSGRLNTGEIERGRERGSGKGRGMGSGSSRSRSNEGYYYSDSDD